ncbi:hypothetical protein [Nostoc sp. DedSLP04]|nr:hypothetical protein [Nostoc sp. DedSLP04]MDZ8035851.1 hypothetical protein [Nostoc sp. DedSLP04]
MINTGMPFAQNKNLLVLLGQTVAFLPVDHLDCWQRFEQTLGTKVAGS